MPTPWPRPPGLLTNPERHGSVDVALRLLGFELVASEPHTRIGVPLVGETWRLAL